MKKVEFSTTGYYTPTGHNPLPTGWRGRMTALKWLATGRRPSVHIDAHKPQKFVLSCFGAGGGSEK